jgi:hypothetical protein
LAKHPRSFSSFASYINLQGIECNLNQGFYTSLHNS